MISEVSMQVTEQKRRTVLPIAVWVVLFVAGIVFEGAGRFFGWRENPSHIWHEWAPLLTVVAAALICIFGYFYFAKGQETQVATRKWTGIVIILLGLTMIGTSFLLRFIVPALFG
jgi:uncharacterized membrane protein